MDMKDNDGLTPADQAANLSNKDLLNQFKKLKIIPNDQPEDNVSIIESSQIMEQEKIDEPMEDL